jgi:hypothetical protein
LLGANNAASGRRTGLLFRRLQTGKGTVQKHARTWNALYTLVAVTKHKQVPQGKTLDGRYGSCDAHATGAAVLHMAACGDKCSQECIVLFRCYLTCCWLAAAALHHHCHHQQQQQQQ